MKTLRKQFSGNNLAELEANVAQFKKEIGDRFIKEWVNSKFPKWVLVVEYREDEKK